MKKLLPIFLLSLLLFSCKKENENFETKIFIVAAQKTMCTPLYGTPHPCLQIKESPNDPFRGFNENIEGFNYVDGFEYTIEVKVYDIKNSPADASSKRYVLARIISKK
jgi:hypothetical protein